MEDQMKVQSLGYYSPFLDWLVIDNNEVGKESGSGNGATVPHEVGHFFSLEHTHFGYDSDPFDGSGPAPVSAPDGGVATELADGSNCETAADMICDTPADYNGFGWGTCNYTGGAQDPTGAPIDPDEDLFMSYFLNCDVEDKYFSDMQQQIVIQDASSAARNYAREENFVVPSPVTEAATLMEPADGAVTDGYNAVHFSWSEVPNAEAYLLEIDRVPSYTLFPERYFVYGNSKTVEGIFDDDKKYYWRVRPFNRLHACQEATSSNEFTTGVSVSASEIQFVNNWDVSPNPVNKDNELNIQMDTEVSFEGTVNLFDIGGKLVHSYGEKRFETGSNKYPLQLNGASQGIYILTIDSEHGKLNKRIVVTN